MKQTARLDRETRGRINQRVTIVGAAWNVLLVAIKLVIGLLGQSQALIADAFHSLADLLNDFGLMIAMYFSRQAPDEEHPYGHERFETLAAFGIGLLLAINGIWLALHNVQRLYHGELSTPESYTLFAALLGIFIKEGMYHYTIRAARLTHSPALKANAWDHRSDAISSIVVFIGIAGTLMGMPYLDATVAILVGLMVLRIGAMTAWEALQELVDRGLGPEQLARIRKLITGVEGVTDLHLLKTRRMGPQALAEVHIEVAPRLSVSEGHQIAERVRRTLLEAVPDLSEATIHIDPENDETDAPLLPPRSEVELRLQRALAEHRLPQPENLLLHYQSGRLLLELCYFLPARGSLDELQLLATEIRDTLLASGIAQDVQILWRSETA
ncbi:cation diffusion facilitator family transporter [Thermithiobacillus plumbiphilus]|uniref:Cation diffusion facilitator family transporter n=1 Tax=Thermithiobacillus plumbiphilus TaxID=1729899 RepID=A0ABU9D752_9PROT